MRWTMIVRAWPGILSLCPPLAAEGRVYLSRNQALLRAFPAAHSVLEYRHVLSGSERSLLQKRLGRRLKERGYLSYLAYDAKGKFLGSAVLTAELGKTEPFLLLVALDPSGKVLDIEVLEYREPRGHEIRSARYLARYRGIEIASARRALRRVPILPGATLSCHGVARAVAKTLLLDAIYAKASKGSNEKRKKKGDARDSKLRAKRLRVRFEKGAAKRIVITEKRKNRRGKTRGTQKQLGNEVGKSVRSSQGLPFMGDVFRIESNVEISRATLERAFACVQSLERKWSPHREQSIPSRLNALAPSETLDLSEDPESFDLLLRAFAKANEFEGRFSPTPCSDRPHELFALDPAQRLVKRLRPGCLDAGAFLKGYAADCVAAILDASAASWRSVGFGSSFLLRRGSGETKAVSCSGTCRRGAHIKDPSTGEALRDGEDVWAFADSAFDAECFSTAEFVRIARSRQA